MADIPSRPGVMSSIESKSQDSKYRPGFEQVLAWLRRPTGASTSSFHMSIFILLVEWFLAWLLMAGFSLMYILDYLCAWWEAIAAVHCDHLHKIPLTTIPQTRSQRSLSFEEQMAEFQALFNSHDDEDQFIMVDNNICNQDAQEDLEEEACLLSMLQNSLRARQLASSLMSLWTRDHAYPNVKSDHMKSDSHRLKVSDDQAKRMLQLQRVWPKALEIPQAAATPTETSPFMCSVIIPTHKEGWEKIEKLLNHTYHHCLEPKRIQIIVVDAGGNQQNNSDVYDGLDIERQNCLWGAWKIVTYEGSGGRGGCMNFGAEHADGEILTFLHADSLLPPNWDHSINRALIVPKEEVDTRVNSIIGEAETGRIRRNLMCAFSMGIESTSEHSGKFIAPTPGIGGADWFLGGIRCTLCQLPYGDSTLSFPSDIFWYLGGYPDQQPLMEDFALVRLMRQHSMVQILRSQSEKKGISQKKAETSWLSQKVLSLQQLLYFLLTAQTLLDNGLVILKDRIACSPRRWQTLGVPYVVLSNAYIIYKYSQENATAEDLFEFYYRQKSLTSRVTADSKINSTSEKNRDTLSHQKEQKPKQS